MKKTELRKCVVIARDEEFYFHQFFIDKDNYAMAIVESTITGKVENVYSTWIHFID